MHTVDADKTCFSSPKITSEFVLAKCQVCCTYQLPRGTPIHKRGGGVRAWKFENDRYRTILAAETKISEGSTYFNFFNST